MTSPQPPSRLRPFRPVTFGRYTLLLPISTGGMGEIFLARMEGAQGFEKLCVIKKILPHLATERDFVERFVHEAKTLVHLSHGSIAQVLDMGVQDDEPFLALEYVDGKDLRKVAARLRDRGSTLPLTVTLYVFSRVLDALAYAHRKRDADEREIRLVHRDISPQNVLVSYEGEVKVIDFGLAKSTLTSASTNPSIVLGKFLYMSPEQARHQPVDRRSDLYSVGLCLYELISGRNPFEAVAPNELMARVASPVILPLEAVAPRCPKALTELVAKALAVEVEDRFQTAEEFRAKLSACLLELDPAAGPENVSRFMRETFAVEYHTERRMLASLRDSLRAEEPRARQATRPDEETAILNLQKLGFEDPFFEGKAPTPSPLVEAPSARAETDPGAPIPGKLLERPETDVRPTRDAHAPVLDEPTPEDPAAGPSPWLSATDPNIAPYVPPAPQELRALPTPVGVQVAQPTMPFPQSEFVPDGIGVPSWRHDTVREPVSAPPPPPPPVPTPLAVPRATPERLPERAVRREPLEPPSRPPRLDMRAVTVPDPEPAPASADEHEPETPPFSFLAPARPRAPSRVKWMMGGSALVLLLAAAVYVGLNGDSRLEEGPRGPPPPTPIVVPPAPEPAPPAGQWKVASQGPLAGPPEEPATSDADLLAPLNAAPDATSPSAFPKLPRPAVRRGAVLSKEWSRTRQVFSRLVRARPCVSEGMSPLCVRYGQLSHDMGDAAGALTDEQLLARIRELRKQLEAKAP